MRVIYYTATCFLDISLEIINTLKKEVDLYVLIEITPQTKKLNIIDIDQLPNFPTLVDPGEILTKKDYKYFQPYLEGTLDVKFIIHPHETGISFTTIQACNNAGKYIRKVKPDIIHLESMSPRALPLIPYLKLGGKIFITIHDSMFHSGEKNFKLICTKFLYAQLSVSKIFFYSNFSKHQFEKSNKNNKTPKFVLLMQPYTFYKNYLPKKQQHRKHILFFGRISAYKGVDILLKEISSVFANLPNEKLIIAGKCVEGYSLDEGVLNKYNKNITFINRYISNEELVSLISQAKFVICPYKDATQSGVLMTAFALNAPVIATDVGAFTEYIEENKTGILVKLNNSNHLSQIIINTLNNNTYLLMEKEIQSRNDNDTWCKTKYLNKNEYLL